MPQQYRVKIGEVHVHSDKPITPEERKNALKELKQANPLIVTADGLQIVLAVDRH